MWLVQGSAEEFASAMGRSATNLMALNKKMVSLFARTKLRTEAVEDSAVVIPDPKSRRCGKFIEVQNSSPGISRVVLPV